MTAALRMDDLPVFDEHGAYAARDFEHRGCGQAPICSTSCKPTCRSNRENSSGWNRANSAAV
jgi:hypothetical protein